MSDNILKLKKLLIKHIKIKQENQKKLLDAINIVKKTMNKKIREEQTRKLKQIYKEDIADYLCNELTSKDIYRDFIRNKLTERGYPGVLKNVNLFYCKFGNKNLGYDYPSKTSKKKDYQYDCITHIKNSIFLNVSFANTNLTGIKFYATKFIGGHSKTNDILTKENIFSQKTNINYGQDNFNFSNAKLLDCEFTLCDFYDITFESNIIYGSTSYGMQNGSGRYNSTYFNMCNFNNLKFKIPKNINNLENTNVIERHSMDRLFHIVSYEYNEIQDTLIYEVDQSSLSHMPPKLIFEKCNFIDTVFIKSENKTPPILFKNCKFSNSNINHFNFDKLDLNNFIFENCEFNKIHFKQCNIDGCIFINCVLNNVNFDNVNFAFSSQLTEFDNCKLFNCTFLHCIFKNYFDNYTLVIKYNCFFENTLFSSCTLINFKFNHYTFRNKKSSSSLLHVLSLKKSIFHNCELYGTNFDYCDLEGSRFSIIGTTPQKINWFGQTYIKSNNLPFYYNEIDVDDLNPFYNAYFTDTLNLQISKSRSAFNSIFNIKFTELRNNSDLTPEKIREKYFSYDFFKIFTGPPDNRQTNKYLFVSPTSFYGANIRSCNFQQIEGFEGFDFTVLKYFPKKENTRDNIADLNGVDFTAVDLTNANFSNCNLIGTIFQVADIKGADFQNSITNENTDFENTLNVGLALNTNHINFGELQNNANETHARSQFIINNRNKLSNLALWFKYPGQEKDTIIQDLLTISENLNVNDVKINSYKRFLNDNLPNKLTKLISKKLGYNEMQKALLRINFRSNDRNKVSIINDEFINILLSKKNPLRDGTPGVWSWINIIAYSLIILYNSSKLYVHIFMQYYFNEVFNAHGIGSASCTLGMVERLVTIHSQASEAYIMMLDINNPSDENINSLQKFDSSNEELIDETITKEFIEKFNDPSKIIFSTELPQLHKYYYHKLINILKPNSDLPESKEEDIGIEFDYTITPEMRKIWHLAIKLEIDSEKITNLNDVTNHFLKYMNLQILFRNNITPEKIKEFNTNSSAKKKELFLKKIEKINNFLLENEIPLLREAIIYMYGTEESDINLENLKDYFEEAGRLRRRRRKAKGHTIKVKSLSLNKTKSYKFPITKTQSAKYYNSKKFGNIIEKMAIKNFSNLSQKKLEKFYIKQETINLNNMDITDKPYRDMIKKQLKKMNENRKYILDIIKKNKGVNSSISKFINISSKKNVSKRKRKSKSESKSKSKSESKSKSKTIKTNIKKIE